ncbi:hypothetical protein H310_11098 [Aphanomyces invadans]|uniref:Uncharacterized protein n=1 Tax=Aphanomyces invadans TaxID=157072 RepID=A0A024TQN9_9STRA|nr:hypothetical protein H310_11098 [Aphanomyces invadans]ETV95682.1 hypothetical protein H310_11098 [Aphanomyces invadans]|eukprot:XP_008875875.1 hypothetical protein H310_11098 [Aphanomyces invadans]
MLAENTYDALRDAIWTDDVELLHHHMRSGRVDVNHTDSAGQTLLHLAAFWGRTEMVRVLISLGGSMKAKNATGCTALDLAIHWGHSATAEVIRLRGGTSVWEEKMGLLQMQVEDLTTSLADVERQNRDKEASLAHLRAEIVELHAHWAEAVDTCNAQMSERDKVTNFAANLEKAVSQLHHDVESLKKDLYDSQMEGYRLDRAREQAELERDAAVEQRGHAIQSQNAALDVVSQRTKDWQAAERAAVIMETQRNQAFRERDHIQRRLTAATVELELQTERLAYAQAEHQRIEEEAADFLHAKRQEDIRLKRAARALEEFSADKKAAALEAARAFSQQQANRRRQLGMAPAREDRHRQRAQTAAAVETQQHQHDLASFEAEFVHTIKAFTEGREAKWTRMKALDQQSRFAADRAALRPLAQLKVPTSHSRESTLSIIVATSHRRPPP